MDTDPVKQTLDLLRGMQALKLVPQSVEIDDDGIKVSNIGVWDPPSLNPKLLHPDELDGHGVPPDA